MLGSVLLHRTFILRCPFRFVGFDPSLLHIDDGFCVVYPRWNGLLWTLTLLTCRLLSLKTNHMSSFRDPPMLNWKFWACNGARKLLALLDSENHASVVGHFVLRSLPISVWMLVVFVLCRWPCVSGTCVRNDPKECYLVDPASSHMLVSKIKPCMCKYEQIQTVKLRMAH